MLVIFFSLNPPLAQKTTKEIYRRYQCYLEMHKCLPFNIELLNVNKYLITSRKRQPHLPQGGLLLGDCILEQILETRLPYDRLEDIRTPIGLDFFPEVDHQPPQFEYMLAPISNRSDSHFLT